MAKGRSQASYASVYYLTLISRLFYGKDIKQKQRCPLLSYGPTQSNDKILTLKVCHMSYSHSVVVDFGGYWVTGGITWHTLVSQCVTWEFLASRLSSAIPNFLFSSGHFHIYGCQHIVGHSYAHIYLITYGAGAVLLWIIWLCGWGYHSRGPMVF